MKLSPISAVALLAASATAANTFAARPRLVPPVVNVEGFSFAVADASSGATNGTGFFTQLLDHDNPSAGTFQQRFWWSNEYWEGPGSPVRPSPLFG
jgi:hypothetical protein